MKLSSEGAFACLDRHSTACRCVEVSVLVPACSLDDQAQGLVHVLLFPPQVAPNSDGIQKLLAAEQEASRIVAEARKGACFIPHGHPHALGRLFDSDHIQQGFAQS